MRLWVAAKGAPKRHDAAAACPGFASPSAPGIPQLASRDPLTIPVKQNAVLGPESEIDLLALTKDATSNGGVGSDAGRAADVDLVDRTPAQI
jgi:hypothetical protein